MGLLEFNKLPINTLVGADWKRLRQSLPAVILMLLIKASTG